MMTGFPSEISAGCANILRLLGDGVGAGESRVPLYYAKQLYYITYTHIYIYNQIYIYVYTFMYIYMIVCIYTYICICMYLYLLHYKKSVLGVFEPRYSRRTLSLASPGSGVASSKRTSFGFRVPGFRV